MPVIINGTTGITDVNGTAAAPALTGTDTDTGIFFPAANTLAFSTNGTEDARFDSAGNFGLGVTPSAWGGGQVGLQVKNASLSGFSNSAYVMANTYYDGTSEKYIASSFATKYAQASGAHLWYSAASGTAGSAITFTQAMTLFANGNLSIGSTTSAGTTRVAGIEGTSSGYFQFGRTNATSGGGIVGTDIGPGIQFYTYTGSFGSESYTERARIDSSGRLLVGYNSAGGVGYPTGSVGAVGYIAKKGTANGLNSSGNTFNISWADGLAGAHVWIDTSDLGQITFVSDYRIKKNVVTQTAPAIDRVMQLRPITYEFADYKNLFNADGIRREGFIAHEVQEVIPSGAEGEKDAENCIQSLRLDAILSVAVKAIQEQQAMIASQSAIITQLQADVAALKGQA